MKKNKKKHTILKNVFSLHEGLGYPLKYASGFQYPLFLKKSSARAPLQNLRLVLLFLKNKTQDATPADWNYWPSTYATENEFRDFCKSLKRVAPLRITQSTPTADAEAQPYLNAPGCSVPNTYYLDRFLTDLEESENTTVLYQGCQVTSWLKYNEDGARRKVSIL